MKKTLLAALIGTTAALATATYLLGKAKGLIEGHNSFVEQFSGEFDEEYEELCEVDDCEDDDEF